MCPREQPADNLRPLPDGYNGNCDLQKPWQQASLALASEGMAGDLFWQWGETFSSGPTHNDGNTVFYGSELAQCLVTEHVEQVNASS